MSWSVFSTELTFSPASVPGIGLPTDVGFLLDQLRLEVADALGEPVHPVTNGIVTALTSIVGREFHRRGAVVAVSGD